MWLWGCLYGKNQPGKTGSSVYRDLTSYLIFPIKTTSVYIKKCPGKARSHFTIAGISVAWTFFFVVFFDINTNLKTPRLTGLIFIALRMYRFFSLVKIKTHITCLFFHPGKAGYFFSYKQTLQIILADRGARLTGSARLHINTPLL